MHIYGFLPLRKVLIFTKDSVFIPDPIVLTRFCIESSS